MKFSYSWLKEFLPSLPSPKETATLLTLHALEVGDLRREFGDWVFDIDVLPNRMADASSHEGIAREIRAILAVQKGKAPPLRAIQQKLREDQKTPVASMLRVRVEDREGCSLYGARVVMGVRVRPSPPWLQKRLRLVGVEPVNNIVDAANYVMVELGQPLHAFDLDKIAHSKWPTANSKPSSKSYKPYTISRKPKLIIVRKAKRGEKITTLDGEERELPAHTTVIADAQIALAIGGIKGGAEAAITEETKDIAIEAALFDPATIYRTSRALRLQTDASKRFEAGRAPEDVLRALDRAVVLTAEVAGGRIAAGRVAVGKSTGQKRVVPFSSERAEHMLGMPVGTPRARRALKAIGCSIRSRISADQWAVIPPPNRLDLKIEEDLIEEVGRLVGYYVISTDMPAAPMSVSVFSPRHLWADRARDVLTAQGLSEAMRVALVSSSFLAQWGFRGTPAVALENPQSSEATHLRPALLPRLLALAAETRRSGSHAEVFEIGHVFCPGKNGIEEQERLGIVQALPGEKGGFYALKGYIQDLCERCGVSNVAWRPVSEEKRWYHPGKSAKFFIGGKAIGVVGELHPRALKEYFPIGDAVAAAEIDFDAFADAASEEHEYRAPSRYPEVVRDIAALVSEETLADTVEQEIERVGGTLVRDVELFDYFVGERLPEGRKSLAFRIVYQSGKRTLTSQEVDRLHKRIERALRARGWEVR